MNSVIIDIELLQYILNSKFKIISIYIYSRGSMKSVIIDIELLRYILNSKYRIISIYLITLFHEQRYSYRINKIYFEFKI